MLRKIFGAIFGSASNTKTVVDGAVAGIDALVFTDEEKSVATKEAREWFIRYLEASQPQNVARRFIAIIVTMLWCFLVVYAVIAFTVQFSLQGGGEVTDQTMVVAEFTFRVLKDIVAVPFAGLMTFYFAKHLLAAYKTEK